MTIKEFALELNISQTELLTKLNRAGIIKTINDELSSAEKAKFSDFLSGVSQEKPRKARKSFFWLAIEITATNKNSQILTEY